MVEKQNEIEHVGAKTNRYSMDPYIELQTTNYEIASMEEELIKQYAELTEVQKKIEKTHKK